MELFEKALSLYGPMIMGWVVAFILWKRYDARNNSDAEHIQKETEAKFALAAALGDQAKLLEELSDIATDTRGLIHGLVTKS